METLNAFRLNRLLEKSGLSSDERVEFFRIMEKEFEEQEKRFEQLVDKRFAKIEQERKLKRQSQNSIIALYGGVAFFVIVVITILLTS